MTLTGETSKGDGFNPNVDVRKALSALETKMAGYKRQYPGLTRRDYENYAFEKLVSLGLTSTEARALISRAGVGDSFYMDESVTIPPGRAAGMMIQAKSGNILLLHRGPSAPDCAGCWDFPGGGREGEETSIETAKRECEEEIGQLPKGIPLLHTRTSSTPPVGVVGVGAAPVLPVQDAAPAAPPPMPVPFPMPVVDFVTYLLKVDDEFVPQLNDEHDGYVWASPECLPGPMHPGCMISIDRLRMNELDVARAIADGRLASPQVYENLHLWAIRITGTDVAFRPKEGEFVQRNPEHYLTPDFLARCNGLPVIFKHPKAAILNSEEFSNRIVGTIFLPYVAGDEVWGIAKIYDDEANQLMGDLSTSPGVNFKDFSVNMKLVLEDGSKVLIEGNPSLVDHVAVCELGVWDKGGEPTGIRSEARGDSVMADEDKAKDDAAKMDAKKDETAKKDADAGTKPDNSLSHALADAMKPFGDAMTSMADSIKGLAGRFDAFETRKDAAKKDNEEDSEGKVVKDAVKDALKDALLDAKDEDAEAEKAKKAAADNAKKDAKKDEDMMDTSKKDDVGDLRRQINDVKAMIPKSIGDADYYALTDSQSRADDVFAKFGLHAPRPLSGETPAGYDRRVVKMLKEHSATWKGVDVASTAFADDAVFAPIRDQVYREASAAAVDPTRVPTGTLREVVKRHDGHTIREFHGSPAVWMNPMAGAVKMKAEGSWKHNLGNNAH